jgi:hypothetical protein
MKTVHQERRTKMRKALILFVAILASLASVNSASAQLEKGQMEVSFSASFMGIKEDGQDMKTALNLPFRLGYFVTKGFEIEPEMIISTYEGYEPGYIFSANLLYNASPLGNSKACPFFLVGIGWSNALHHFNQLNLGDTGNEYLILNLGIGSKFLLSASAALRLEYRFQRFVFQKKASWLNHVHDPSVSYHNLFFGIALFPR